MIITNHDLHLSVGRMVVSSHGVKIHYYNYLIIMPLMQSTMVKKIQFSNDLCRMQVN